jgi:isochorismate pyruvate lyase
MKRPIECASIDEVRNEIDQIDQEVIRLIATRYEYVKEIVRFKTNAEDVKAQKRYVEVFEKRRQWAVENGLSPDAIEQVYKTLVHYFIDEQMKMIKK